MSSKYNDKIIEIFSSLNIPSFRADFTHPVIFICGGSTDKTLHPPPNTFRFHYMNYCDDHQPEFFPYLILAERFIDYLSGSKYTDLLTFEDEIAQISSLIVIFLESPGSLVELGLFCNAPNINKKLLVVAPFNHVKGNSSFISLGPLTYLKNNMGAGSVLTYKFPEELGYDASNLQILHEDIVDRLGNILDKKEKFKIDNSGHVSFLIHDIIQVTQPVKLHEIIAALNAVGINKEESSIRRYLYLLECSYLIKTINLYDSDYYYSINNDNKIVFGLTKEKVAFDRP